MLLKKGIQGLSWLTIIRFLKYLIQFFNYLIFSQVLTPEMFGLVSVGLIFLTFLNQFRDLGFSSAIIFHDNNDRQLSTLFWFSTFVGILLFIFTYIFKGSIAGLFGLPDSEYIILALSISFIISGFLNFYQALYDKKLLFKKVILLEFTAIIISTFVLYYLLYTGFNEWSIVFQILLNQLIFSVLLFVNIDWRPNATFNLKSITSSFDFGLHLSGFQVLNYIVRNSDKFIIARSFGDSSLGVYNLAYQLVFTPLQNITGIINRVLFPILKKVDNDKKLGEIFTSSSYLFVSSLMPFVMYFIFFSQEFVFFFKNEWIQVADFLTLFMITLAIQITYVNGGVIFLVKGKTKLWFQLSIVTSAITISAYIIGSFYGMVGVAYGYLFSNIILFAPNFIIPLFLLKTDIKAYTLDILGPVILLCLLGYFSYFITISITQNSIFKIFFGIIFYFSGVLTIYSLILKPKILRKLEILKIELN